MKIGRRPLGLVLASASVVLLAACSSSDAEPAPAAFTARPVLAADAENPMIAEGVTIAKDAYFYKSSGLGPEALNDAAPEGSPESFIDTDAFADGALTGGVTITEAQGLNALARIKANLEQQGLSLADVVSMRVFLDNAPGTDRADYAGWNRAYRQYFANTNLKTGDTELVPLGTGAPAAPLERNPARPSRFALEVASLPVPGWLVEIEVDAVYPADKEPE
ncbi:hypothetical protein IU433_22930 [Nocardia puris]|uniref:Enamine deaminase RidA (YjgF/YER057c/UK114 family) n=1 Tax=Nocardia puris TaxID=208602 RepID=A0A366DE47_9NOCA|nr:Rid family hydrolase [Nocardia puris]MBF6212127.1 hypothetical protein [Nocardia puris]MBF6367153.1 hypothetical protein [Nocardia puris]MBF6461870.1 hypothetical protein [Nocardia puris]RBO88327.1 enamine deaminase RidA (YjgF/YER057c/UK114 family) [Nocardia puris]